MAKITGKLEYPNGEPMPNTLIRVNIQAFDTQGNILTLLSPLKRRSDKDGNVEELELPNTTGRTDQQPYVADIPSVGTFSFPLSVDTTWAELVDQYATKETGSPVGLDERLAQFALKDLTNADFTQLSEAQKQEIQRIIGIDPDELTIVSIGEDTIFSILESIGTVDRTKETLTGIDASKIADGSVNNTEFQRLDGVDENIQDQFDKLDVELVQLESLGLHEDVPLTSDGTNAATWLTVTSSQNIGSRAGLPGVPRVISFAHDAILLSLREGSITSVSNGQDTQRDLRGAKILRLIKSTNPNKTDQPASIIFKVSSIGNPNNPGTGNYHSVIRIEGEYLIGSASDFNLISNRPLSVVEGSTALIITEKLNRDILDDDDSKQDKITSTNRLNANLVGTGNVDNTELDRLDGIEGNVQSQLDAIDTDLNILDELKRTWTASGQFIVRSNEAATRSQAAVYFNPDRDEIYISNTSSNYAAFKALLGTDGGINLTFSNHGDSKHIVKYRAVATPTYDDSKHQVRLFGGYTVGSATTFATTTPLVISGEELSESKIADISFSNPPGDLSNAEKQAVREAIGSGEGSLEEVATDNTLTGDGTSSDPLKVAKPFTGEEFTTAEQTKLAGIEEGAQKNVGVEYTQTEKDKLTNIEANAKDDQTAAEIKDALETLTGTNRLDASAIQNIPSGSGGGSTTYKAIYAYIPGTNPPTATQAGIATLEGDVFHGYPHTFNADGETDAYPDVALFWDDTSRHIIRVLAPELNSGIPSTGNLILYRKVTTSGNQVQIQRDMYAGIRRVQTSIEDVDAANEWGVFDLSEADMLRFLDDETGVLAKAVKDNEITEDNRLDASLVGSGKISNDELDTLEGSSINVHEALHLGILELNMATLKSIQDSLRIAARADSRVVNGYKWILTGDHALKNKIIRLRDRSGLISAAGFADTVESIKDNFDILNTLPDEVGELAFKNVPTDLTDDEKKLVREAIGSGTESGGTTVDADNHISAEFIADGSVSNAAFQYLSNVTSDIQAQINSKEDNISSSNRIAAGTIANGTISNTEFQTLNNINTGVTIQAQLNSKLDASPTDVGDIAFSNPPGDLTAEEQTNVREAIGASSEDTTFETFGSRGEQITIQDETTALSADHRLSPTASSPITVTSGTGDPEILIAIDDTSGDEHFTIAAGGPYLMELTGEAKASGGNSEFEIDIKAQADDTVIAFDRTVKRTTNWTRFEKKFVIFEQSDIEVYVEFIHGTRDIQLRNVKLEFFRFAAGRDVEVGRTGLFNFTNLPDAAEYEDGAIEVFDDIYYQKQTAHSVNNTFAGHTGTGQQNIAGTHWRGAGTRYANDFPPALVGGNFHATGSFSSNPGGVIGFIFGSSNTDGTSDLFVSFRKSSYDNQKGSAFTTSDQKDIVFGRFSSSLAGQTITVTGHSVYTSDGVEWTVFAATGLSNIVNLFQQTGGGQFNFVVNDVGTTDAFFTHTKDVAHWVHWISEDQEEDRRDIETLREADEIIQRDVADAKAQAQYAQNLADFGQGVALTTWPTDPTDGSVPPHFWVASPLPASYTVPAANNPRNTDYEITNEHHPAGEYMVTTGARKNEGEFVIGKIIDNQIDYYGVFPVNAYLGAHMSAHGKSQQSCGVGLHMPGGILGLGSYIPQASTGQAGLRASQMQMRLADYNMMVDGNNASYVYMHIRKPDGTVMDEAIRFARQRDGDYTISNSTVSMVNLENHSQTNKTVTDYFKTVFDNNPTESASDVAARTHSYFVNGSASDKSTHWQLGAGELKGITLQPERTSGEVRYVPASEAGIIVQEEGTSLTTRADTLNFVGDNVTASGTGSAKTITIMGGSGGGVNTSVAELRFGQNTGDWSFNQTPTLNLDYYGSGTNADFISYSETGPGSNQIISLDPGLYQLEVKLRYTGNNSRRITYDIRSTKPNPALGALKGEIIVGGVIGTRSVYGTASTIFGAHIDTAQTDGTANGKVNLFLNGSFDRSGSVTYTSLTMLFYFTKLA